MTGQTWIFQASPKLFDIDGYLATQPSDLLWLVTRSADRMRVGDTVFLWRAVGDGPKDRSGVVAETQIIGTAIERPEEDAARPFWLEGDLERPQPRARLSLIRSANRRETIQREWLKDDPVLRDLTILTARVGTNFLLTAPQAARLRAMWSRTGRDWDYAESVAGMWAYHCTYGGQVSRKPGSPVAECALLTGRSVPGAYNTVMNFRHLDPRDGRAGLSGAAKSDRDVWEKFFDALAGEIKADALEREYRRLWSTEEAASIPPLDDDLDDLEREVAKLRHLTLDQLLERYARRRKALAASSRSLVQSTRRYDRSPMVVAIAKARASRRCEIFGCTHPTFLTAVGEPYVEVHHIVPLEEGGPDEIDNAACVCPAHHRELHLGKRAAELTLQLKSLRLSERKSAAEPDNDAVAVGSYSSATQA